MSDKKGILGALVGIVSAVTGAATGSSDVVKDYGKYSHRDREDKMEQYARTSTAAENTKSAGDNRSR